MDKVLLNQEEIGKCLVMLTMIMERYSNTGPNDMDKFNEISTEMMHMLTEKLTVTNQEKFTEYLIRKTEQKRRELGLM